MGILCYHAASAGWDSPLAVEPSRFAEQCAWLARRTSVVSALEMAEAFVAGRHLPADTRSITFDDGFADFVDGALPSLLRHGLPVTMFVVAGSTLPGGGGADWLVPQPDPAPATLTGAQVRDLHERGVTIGNHSWAHHDLRQLGEAECTRDLRESRECLEDLVGAPVPLLAYPYGFHSEHVRRAAAAAGHEYAFSLPQGPEPTGPLAVPRVGIYRRNSVTGLRIKTSRFYLNARMHPGYARLRGSAPVVVSR
jgi:peptidoglycan/xylan/chitin deacetylase (PgdA/CDA1 family)